MPTAPTQYYQDGTAFRSDFGPADHGWKAWNYDILYAVAGSTGPTAGRIEVVKIRLPAPAPITNVLLYANTGGSGLTAGQCFAALHTAAGAKIAQTADQATAWATAGLKTMALSGGPYSRAAGDYYVVFWFNGTTSPAWIRINAGVGINANLSASNFRWATADTGITTTGPSSLGTQSAQGNPWWVGLS